MEIKINKEIRDYSENVFFGLTMRQFFFSVLGCFAAVGIYFLCKDTFGVEITTWLCVIGVVPFGVMGFIKYNGLTAEQIAIVFIKSKFLYPRRYISNSETYYYGLLKANAEIEHGKTKKKDKRKNRERKKDVKDIKDEYKTAEREL